jgi:hypothetical protein
VDSLAENNVGCRCCYVLLSWDYNMCREAFFNVFEKGTLDLRTLGENRKLIRPFGLPTPRARPACPPHASGSSSQVLMMKNLSKRATNVRMGWVRKGLGARARVGLC